MNFKIESRWDGGVLFEGEFGSLILCVEAAVKADANLAGANLAGAYLADANLVGAYLADANLADANLVGANLAGAYLAGAYLADANLADANLADANLAGANLARAYLAGAKNLPIPDADEIKRLDEVREIVLKQPERLRMSGWHFGKWTPDHTPEEEHACGSAHCIAGWLQALSHDPALRKISAKVAGTKLAPASSYMFFTSDAVALQWLKDRGYAKMAERVNP